MKLKQILAIFIVMLLVAVALPFVATADTTQTWYFTDDVYAGTKIGNIGGEIDDVMYKEPTLDATASVALSWDEEAYWYAENPATVNVSFGEYDWQTTIWYDITGGASTTLSVNVYSMDSSGTATSLAYVTPSISDPSTPPASTNITITDFASTSQNIPSGDRLVFGIENLTEGTTITIYFNSFTRLSYLQSPPSDPGYPIPELPTIILLATGLAFLAAYLGLKRRNRAYVRA